MKDIIKNATVVDVRTPEEFSVEHFDGAINIPLNEIQTRLDEFKAMQQPIVMYCRSGNRSGMATSLLQQQGISEVYNGGGLADMLRQAK